MSDDQYPSHGTQPPTSPKGHPLPRRSSPEKSITLHNHRMAHEANAKELSMHAAAAATRSESSSPYRQSSGESHNTGPSDPNKWFEQSNENPKALYSNGIDIDPPFFQKESDSSNEDNPQPTSYPTYLRPPVQGTLKPSATHSSSADDYRSVIDDLTVEISRLKDELKRYKQKGPEMMKQDRLFEIKVHGLPKRKKRELESTLRDFASGLEGSTPSAEASSARNKSRHKARLESGSGSASKHASSTSGSHSRPVDSAYASMSTGANSSGTSLRPSASSRTKSSEQKVENYLKDIPEGLYPRHMVLTDKDKKKLIVRRLEQIFTGKISGRSVSHHQPKSSGNIASYAPFMVEPATGNTTTTHGPSNVPLGFYEPSREARILMSEQKKDLTKDNGSTSNSNGDQHDSFVNSGITGTSPLNPPLPEQRPTRPLDLDPDRKQNPSANMDYIRHLGLAPPHLTGLATHEDVSPDADGWVYLNLLCNMAQLHMINVAPDYIRSAVSEKSTKFQLSSDGRKIRWRGGTDGTKFSSDSSGDVSQTSLSDASDEAHDAEHSKKRKRRQASKSGPYLTSAGQNSSDQSKFGQKISSADSFHYKPLFVHQSSSAEQTSLDDSNSSGAGDGSNNGVSRWGNSGSGSARRKRRRLDGAIIYYSGAPFCMDLSGDPGDMSPSSYLTSTGEEQQSPSSHGLRPVPQRTESGSTLPYRPLIEGKKAPSVAVVTEGGVDDSDMDIDAGSTWANGCQDPVTINLDACGLGGVIPDDHFRVVVTTKRPKINATPSSPSTLKRNDVGKLVDRIKSPLGASSQVGLFKPKTKSHLPVTIEYTARSVEKLNPTPLPPPGMFFSFDSDTSETSSEDISEIEAEQMAFVGSFENQVHPLTIENQYPDDADMSSGDEEDVEPDDGDEPAARMDDESSEEFDIPIIPGAVHRASSSSAVAAAGTARSHSKSLSADLPIASGSSVATVGGAESGYSSSREESG